MLLENPIRLEFDVIALSYFTLKKKLKRVEVIEFSESGLSFDSSFKFEILS